MDPRCGNRRADPTLAMDPSLSKSEYVRIVLEAYRRMPGTTGAVRRSDRQLAAVLYDRGVPVSAVENALTLAAARRIFRPPLLPPLQLIRSLHYLRPVIDEVLELRVSPDYFRHLQHHIDRALGSTDR